MAKQKKGIKIDIDKKKLKEFLSGFGVKENQNRGVIVLVILLVFIIGYFILRPLNISLRNTKINITNLGNEKEILTEKKAKLDDLEKELEESKDYIAATADILPAGSEVPEILLTLEKLAVGNSLYITNFSPREKFLFKKEEYI